MAQVIAGASAAVLAGGRSSRFGSNKALAPWGRKTLVESAADLLAGLFDETLVVVKTADPFLALAKPGVRVVPDAFAEPHPLGGLWTALTAAAAPKVFVCACDMPFLSPLLIETLVAAASGYEAAVPVWDGKPQPLCAVYSRDCAGVVARRIEERRLSVRELFDIVPTRFLLEAEVRAADPEGRSLLDLDTRPDYEAALRTLPC